VTEISDLPPEMRARRCHDLAEDARRSAVGCNGMSHAHYLYLAEQWEKLAADWSDYLVKRPDIK
jgi:hypothetical protein